MYLSWRIRSEYQVEAILLDMKLKLYIQENKDQFERSLLSQAVNVRDKINDILKYGDIDLINNAHKLVSYVLENKEQKLRDFAK